MNLTEHSRTRLMATFALWDVPKDFADPLYNYLVFGYSPGSCFTAVLANDFHGAIRNSHPSNTVEALKALAGWVNDTIPTDARGSYSAVKRWTTMTDEDRRAVLEEHRLIHTEQEEVWLALEGKPVKEPVLYYNMSYTRR